ncbi:unnamed protein product [Orchesella dallaii]|uniref:C2H2-type domain-containing protein n=1 Tax=Orchesella dallaii TaxID=48710 RepID=A0ABP1Q6E9_9HEXA
MSSSSTAKEQKKTNFQLRFESFPQIWEIGEDLGVSNGSVSSDVGLPQAISPEGNEINRGPAVIDPSPPSTEGGDDGSETGREVDEENREVPAAPGPSIPSAEEGRRPKSKIVPTISSHLGWLKTAFSWLFRTGDHSHEDFDGGEGDAVDKKRQDEDVLSPVDPDASSDNPDLPETSKQQRKPETTTRMPAKNTIMVRDISPIRNEVEKMEVDKKAVDKNGSEQDKNMENLITVQEGLERDQVIENNVVPQFISNMKRLVPGSSTESGVSPTNLRLSPPPAVGKLGDTTQIMLVLPTPPNSWINPGPPRTYNYNPPKRPLTKSPFFKYPRNPQLFETVIQQKTPFETNQGSIYGTTSALDSRANVRVQNTNLEKGETDGGKKEAEKNEQRRDFGKRINHGHKKQQMEEPVGKLGEGNDESEKNTLRPSTSSTVAISKHVAEISDAGSRSSPHVPSLIISNSRMEENTRTQNKEGLNLKLNEDQLYSIQWKTNVVLERHPEYKIADPMESNTIPPTQLASSHTSSSSNSLRMVSREDVNLTNHKRTLKRKQNHLDNGDPQHEKFIRSEENERSPLHHEQHGSYSERTINLDNKPGPTSALLSWNEANIPISNVSKLTIQKVKDTYKNVKEKNYGNDNAMSGTEIQDANNGYEIYPDGIFSLTSKSSNKVEHNQIPIGIQEDQFLQQVYLIEEEEISKLPETQEYVNLHFKETINNDEEENNGIPLPIGNTLRNMEILNTQTVQEISHSTNQNLNITDKSSNFIQHDRIIERIQPEPNIQQVLEPRPFLQLHNQPNHENIEAQPAANHRMKNSLPDPMRNEILPTQSGTQVSRESSPSTSKDTTTLKRKRSDLKDMYETLTTNYQNPESQPVSVTSQIGKGTNQDAREFDEPDTKKLSSNQEKVSKTQEVDCKNAFPFLCGICDQTFENGNSYKLHQITHKGEESYKYKCPVQKCDERFLDELKMKQHFLSHKKQYICSECHRPYASRFTLNLHKTVHTGERSFICEYCGKRFRVKNDLQIHLRIHTGERNYNCNDCDKTFRTSSALCSHMIIHSGERPYSCDVCDKSFTQINNKTRHMKIHSGGPPYSCEVCDKSFTRKCTRTRHIMHFHKNQQHDENEGKDTEPQPSTSRGSNNI